jgi:hypothetical protein
MKKTLIFLTAIIAFSSCRKTGGTGETASCWTCYLEGTYNGQKIDIDTSMCSKTQDEINQFMAPYNVNGEVAKCVKQ